MAKKPEKPESEKVVPVSMYLEESLVKDIDQMAKETRRSRSQMFAVLVEESVAARRQATATN
jgi:metal-responsive CopG/Arc/MetJ family transcriptional regulator